MAVGTYDPAAINEALNRVRWMVADTRTTKMHLADTEIEAVLGEYGLVLASDADANRKAILSVAVDCARRIIAILSVESETVFTDVGPVKSEAAKTYAELVLAPLEREAGSGSVAPQSVTRAKYPNNFVEGIDTDPAET